MRSHKRHTTSTRSVLARGAATLALTFAVAGCDHEASVVPPLSPRDDLFESYVAIGNSITAGFQSDGINDSTQQRSYAALLAGQMRTRFVHPALRMPGCRPPIQNFSTGARVTTGLPSGTPSTAQTCLGRDEAKAAEVINNTAVPGHLIVDATADVTTDRNNTLTTILLGGKTQVERALDARPTFATIWIGNNEVLGPALTGSTASLPSLATMTAAYDALVAQLTGTGGAAGIKGVLIGVAEVTAVPALVPAPQIASPAMQPFLRAATGKTVVVEPNCATSTSRVSLLILPRIRDYDPANPSRPNTHPPLISCGPTPNAPPPVGDVFILDENEAAAISARVQQFNQYLQTKAGTIDFGFYDPNPFLRARVQAGEILFNPAAAEPFGRWISLDGFHPGNRAHVAVTNELVALINTRYNQQLPALPAP